MEKEEHPYLNKYPLTKAYKYLVIGTMPPLNQLPPGVICKERKKRVRNFSIDYYYGNVATFWRIMKQLYPANIFNTIEGIRLWQDQYCVGITDTIVQCRRKDPCSYKDSDLILEWEDYNHNLKEYVLKHADRIEKLIFTSGENCNNAISNFRIIMGKRLPDIAAKIVYDLPSPSGGSNISHFNSDHATLGLKRDLYNYLLENNDLQDIEYVRKQWLKKQLSNIGDKVNRVPKNMISKYKVWKYKQIFPLMKCVH